MNLAKLSSRHTFTVHTVPLCWICVEWCVKSKLVTYISWNNLCSHSPWKAKFFIKIIIKTCTFLRLTVKLSLYYRSNQEEARYAALMKAKAANTSETVTVNWTIESNVTYTINVTHGSGSADIVIPEVNTDFNIIVFSAIIVGVFLFGILRALMFFKVAVDASQALHNSMFASILRSNIGFFDNNPVGKNVCVVISSAIFT